MNRSLVMGYGNLDRMDDGIAFYVINKLRNRLGQKPLYTYNREPVSLNAQVDCIFVRQLVPELASNAICYDHLVFLDAHVQIDKEDVMFIALAWSMFLARLPTFYNHLSFYRSSSYSAIANRQHLSFHLEAIGLIWVGVFQWRPASWSI